MRLPASRHLPVVAPLQIGPYHNPQETYKYYTLPFCRPETALSPAKKWAGFAEVFEGSEFVNSDLVIPFARRHTARYSVTSS